MREVLHRPPLDKEKFESNWDLIFGKKEWECKWCQQVVPNSEVHNCPNQLDAIHDSEMRYQEQKKKTLGWTDNWTGD